jgi:hypothetical protein
MVEVAMLEQISGLSMLFCTGVNGVTDDIIEQPHASIK